MRAWRWRSGAIVLPGAPGSGWLCAEFVNKFAIRTRFVRWRRRLSGGGTLATRPGLPSCGTLAAALTNLAQILTVGLHLDAPDLSMMTIPFRAGAVAAMTFRMRRRVGQIRPWRRGAASAALALLASLRRWPPRRRRRRAPAAGRPGGAGAGLLPGNRPAGKGGRLALRASDGKTALTVTSERSVNAIAQEFLKVYEALDGNQGLDARFDARLELLSVELLGPLRPALREAACVVFEITPASCISRWICCPWTASPCSWSSRPPSPCPGHRPRQSKGLPSADRCGA